MVNTNTGKSVSRLNELDKKVNGLSQRFQKLGEDMERIGEWGILRVTAPLMAMAGVMTHTASWAEEMNSKFNVVFGDMTEATEKWAADTGKAIGRSRLELMDYLAESQNMLVGIGMARNEATEFSKEITQIGIDLASFNNLAESDAIGSLQSALSGIHTAARSLGAVLNENTLALAMQDMGLKGTFQQLDENRKMQVRFRAIVMQSEDAIGDAERTSGSFANQIRALRGEVKDLSAEMGKELLPYAIQFVGFLRQGVEWFGELNPTTRRWILTAAGIAALIPLALLFLSTLIKIGVFIKGAGGIGAIALLAGKWLFLGTVLYGIIMIIQDVWMYFKGGESVTGQVVDFIGKKLDELVGWFKELPGKVKNALAGMGSAIKSQFADGLQSVRNLLPFSPPKDSMSPLRDLHKAGQSIVNNIREGMHDAASSVSFNAPVGATAAPVMAGGERVFSPTVNITVSGGSSPKETAQMTKAEVERMFPRLMNDFFRREGRKV